MAEISNDSTRLRKGLAVPTGTTNSKEATVKPPLLRSKSGHPAGPRKHGKATEILRLLLLLTYFMTTCILAHGTQLIGIPFYWYDRETYYAWMAVTKQHFGLMITSTTQWWSPTTIRISGDASMAGQLRKTSDGRLECDFPERLVLIANHQIYTDWLYLWWTAYTSSCHGHVYIIMKQSLKWIPLMGPGMQLFSFIFLARKWATDKARLSYRLRKLRTEHVDSLGNKYMDPMWLLIFPEGTNLSANTRRISARWAIKAGIDDGKHTLLPRSTGLQFSLAELKGSVDYLYDCTIAYDPVPEGQYGQDIYTLRSVYFQGRPPQNVNMHWRRFKLSDIPVDDTEQMEKWVLQRWREKDELLDEHRRTGRFPADKSAVTIEAQDGSSKLTGGDVEGYIETEVRLKSPLELAQIYVPVPALGLVANVLIKLVNFATIGRFTSQ